MAQPQDLSRGLESGRVLLRFCVRMIILTSFAAFSSIGFDKSLSVLLWSENFISSAIDVGPTGTMQQDVEFGIIQIVDIALRAMSPAINDPSTAISCVDQLSRITICWLSREPPKSRYYAPPHVLRLVVPWITFQGLLDTAFDQIRHYAIADLAVSLRLIRACHDIASATKRRDEQALLVALARQVLAGSSKHLSENELKPLEQRVASLEASISAEE